MDEKDWCPKIFHKICTESEDNFRSEINEAPLGMENQNEDSNQGLAIRLTPIYGISIPIILREEVSDVDTKIKSARVTLKDSILYADIEIERFGDISFYGDLEIELAKTFQGDGDDEDNPIISKMYGLALYTDVARRYVRMELGSIQNFDAA